MNPKVAWGLPSLWLMTLLMLTACSIVSVDQKTRYRDAEGYFESSLLEQIDARKTSKTWLIKHFGRPWLSEAEGLEGYPEDVGVHTWRFERERQKNTRVLLLFRSRSLDQQHEFLHVVTEGDTVMRAWRDDLANVDIGRLMAAMGYRKTASKPPEVHRAPDPTPDLPDGIAPPASLVVEDISADSVTLSTPATAAPEESDSLSDSVQEPPHSP